MTYVYANNHKFNIYIDRPLEKCMVIKGGENFITAHLKIQKLDEVHTFHKTSSKLIKTILCDVVNTHYKDGKTSPWVYDRQYKIAITSYHIQIFIDSVV